MDWKALIADLANAGWTQPQIAEACKCTQPTISDLANGKTTDPRHALGERLRTLHRKEESKKAKRDKARAD